MTAKKTDELFSLYKQFAESQRRQQAAVVVILSVVIALATALYAWVTWESVAARREANELQRQLIELQRATPPSKAALTQHSDARRAVQASAEVHRTPTRTHPSGQESTGARQTTIDSKTPPAAVSNTPPSPHSWNTRSVMLDRPGRQ
jgi:uncharacterized protein HemX